MTRLEVVCAIIKDLRESISQPWLSRNEIGCPLLSVARIESHLNRHAPGARFAES